MSFCVSRKMALKTRAQEKKDWEELVRAEENPDAHAPAPAPAQEQDDEIPTDSEMDSDTSQNKEPSDTEEQGQHTPREKTPTPPKKTPKRGRGRPPKDKKKKTPKKSPKAESDKDVMIDYLNQCLAAETKKVAYRDRKIRDLKASLSKEKNDNQRLTTQLANHDGKKKNPNTDSQNLVQLKIRKLRKLRNLEEQCQ